MHFKRRKGRRSVRCTLCTPYRWLGNNKDRFKPKEAAIRRDRYLAIHRMVFTALIFLLPLSAIALTELEAIDAEKIEQANSQTRPAAHPAQHSSGVSPSFGSGAGPTIP